MEEDDVNEIVAVQKETRRMLTVKSSRCKFGLLDEVVGLNVKQPFTSFSSSEDLSFWDWTLM